MELTIREERATDIRRVSELIKLSFRSENPACLVSLLRSRKDFIRDLSLVAEMNGIIIGYILLNPVQIQSSECLLKTLWLEPLCVHPHYQEKGVGKAIIKRALNKAKLLEFESVFVTGNFGYYSKFGFEKAEKFGVEPSIPLPAQAFLAMELKTDGLSRKGKVIFPREIFN